MLSKSLDTLAASIKPYPAANKFDPAKILPLIEIGDWLNKHKPSVVSEIKADNSDDPKITIKHAMK